VRVLTSHEKKSRGFNLKLIKGETGVCVFSSEHFAIRSIDKNSGRLKGGEGTLFQIKERGEEPNYRRKTSALLTNCMTWDKRLCHPRATGVKVVREKKKRTGEGLMT